MAGASLVMALLSTARVTNQKLASKASRPRPTPPTIPIGLLRAGSVGRGVPQRGSVAAHDALGRALTVAEKTATERWSRRRRSRCAYLPPPTVTPSTLSKNVTKAIRHY